MDAATNLQNMKKLDDSWNGQDLQTFRKYHTKDCIVRWPNQPPTHGIDDSGEGIKLLGFTARPNFRIARNPSGHNFRDADLSGLIPSKGAV